MKKIFPIPKYSVGDKIKAVVDGKEQFAYIWRVLIFWDETAKKYYRGYEIHIYNGIKYKEVVIKENDVIWHKPIKKK